MDFKTGKTVEIVKEFLAGGGDKFEINGIDLSKAIFMYREENLSFMPIPKGNYTTKLESNILYLNIDENIKTKAYEYQIIYTTDMKAVKYLEEYPELKVLVNKYNDLVEDVTNIVKYAKSTGVKVDTLKMTQILTPLEPNTFWAMNEDEKIVTFPLGDLNSKYEQMVSTLKKEVEELIKTTKNSSLTEIQNKLNEKLKELENLADNLKQNISSAVAGYIADNREQLKGDRGAGITSITATGDKVTVNYDDNKNAVFTVPTIVGRDGKEIKDLTYIDNKLKLTMSDNSSKEVEVKSSRGVKLKKIFDGHIEDKQGNGSNINLGENWKVCICEFSLFRDFPSNFENIQRVGYCEFFRDKNLTEQSQRSFDIIGDFYADVAIINNNLKFVSFMWYLKRIYIIEELEID